MNFQAKAAEKLAASHSEHLENQLEDLKSKLTQAILHAQQLDQKEYDTQVKVIILLSLWCCTSFEWHKNYITCF